MRNDFPLNFNLFNISFYKKKQKNVLGCPPYAFLFFQKKTVQRATQKNHIIFSEKIGEKSDKKMVKKKLKKNSFKKVVKTRSKKWSKLVQKEKNARLKKPSTILTKKLKALVLLGFGKQKPSLYIYNLLINIIRIWYNLNRWFGITSSDGLV